ncbi:uncharacterized protein [Amphiura filiformis]|uniref:uncharacterized protein n=1 Tax=Amphiura filiformis TaxID=82378 RepID=UPI003B228B3E
MSEVFLVSGKILITGDFNIHVDEFEKSEVKQFMDIVENAGFTQHVNVPTHRAGHTIDLLISRPEDDLITDWYVRDRLMSDHFWVVCTLQRKKPQPMKIKQSFRNYQNLDAQTFVEDLQRDLVDRMPSNVDCDDMVEHFETTLKNTIDKYCPLSTKFRTVRPRMPWYNETIHEARRVRRRLENKWNKSKSIVDKEIFVDQKVLVNNLITKAKSEYFHDKLFSACNKDQFSILNSLLNASSKVLPTCDSVSDLSNRFATFFVNKIKKIRQNLDSNVEDSLDPVNANFCRSSLTNDNASRLSTSMNHNEEIDVPLEANSCDLLELRSMNCDEVADLIKKLSNKSCLLDQVPTWLLKENSTLFIPVLTNMINVSFTAGVFPTSLKQAIISPIIKKPTLDANTLQNYRPVSNIKAVAKIMEMAAATRLNEHINRNNLSEKFQSAYKPAHSTETALLRVKSDIASAIDKQHAVLLVMLDLSAAFDTLDHVIFINRLRDTFYIKGNALNWFDTYLRNRSSRVCLSGTFSDNHIMEFGVPQGSILGPLGYNAYTHPIGELLRANGVCFHIYADDTQIYISFDPRVDGACQLALKKLQSCVSEIKQWMTLNKLQLNEAKTEFFVAVSSGFAARLNNITLTLGNVTITPTKSLRSLGIVFDPPLSMKVQISSIIKCVSYHLRNLSRIRRYLTQDACKLAVQSLIFSRIDYGNALLYGANEGDLTRLQRLQNRAARLIMLVGRDHPSAPLLRLLHWLPVRERIKFKLLVYVFKCIHSQSPSYLQELISVKTSAYATRSSKDKTLLSQPKTKTRTGDHSFESCAPRLWNTLPRDIRETGTLQLFKANLKTYLFK